MNVPYVSQTGNSISNDCGEACVSMVGRYQGKDTTIEQVQDAMRRWNQADSLSNLRKAADYLGIKTKQFTYIALDPLASAIGTEHPAICLVNYGKIPPYAKTSSYDGGHFIVVHEIDNWVWYHDPLYKANVQITRKEFTNAFKNSALVDDYTKPAPPIIEELEMSPEEFTEATCKAEGARLTAERIWAGLKPIQFWKYKKKATVYVGRPKDKGTPVPNVNTFYSLGGEWGAVVEV